MSKENARGMQDDTISRQAAIREYQEVCKGIKCGECPLLIKVNTEKGSHLITDCKLEAFLHDLPSAQPEIIRCKDCKYAEYIDDVQTLWCTECGQGRTVAPNDFCSYAERREVTT